MNRIVSLLVLPVLVGSVSSLHAARPLPRLSVQLSDLRPGYQADHRGTSFLRASAVARAAGVSKKKLLRLGWVTTYESEYDHPDGATVTGTLSRFRTPSGAHRYYCAAMGGPGCVTNRTQIPAPRVGNESQLFIVSGKSDVRGGEVELMFRQGVYVEAIDVTPLAREASLIRLGQIVSQRIRHG